MKTLVKLIDTAVATRIDHDRVWLPHWRLTNGCIWMLLSPWQHARETRLCLWRMPPLHLLGGR